MRTYTDEYIEFWGDIFVSNNFQTSGVRFEEFITLPKEYTEAITFEQAMPIEDDFYPLSPAQQQVQDKMDEAQRIQEEMEADMERKGHIVELHGPRTIEPMHHRASPKKWKTNTRTVKL